MRLMVRGNDRRCFLDLRTSGTALPRCDHAVEIEVREVGLHRQKSRAARSGRTGFTGKVALPGRNGGPGLAGAEMLAVKD